MSTSKRKRLNLFIVILQFHLIQYLNKCHFNKYILSTDTISHVQMLRYSRCLKITSYTVIAYMILTYITTHPHEVTLHLSILNFQIADSYIASFICKSISTITNLSTSRRKNCSVRFNIIETNLKDLHKTLIRIKVFW